MARFRHRRRLDELRNQPRRLVSSGRGVHQPGSQRREARRPSGRASDEIRIRHQSQRRQGAPPGRAVDAARARRRGDRVMRRREVITLLGGAAASSILWPLAARAQKPAIPVIGYFSAGAANLSAQNVNEFRKGLGESGYLEGRNLAIEFRWANNEVGRLPGLAADLIQRRVAVIATPSSMAAAVA